MQYNVDTLDEFDLDGNVQMETDGDDEEEDDEEEDDQAEEDQYEVDENEGDGKEPRTIGQ